MTKKDLKKELDTLEIEYEKKATVEELQTLYDDSKKEEIEVSDELIISVRKQASLVDCMKQFSGKNISE